MAAHRITTCPQFQEATYAPATGPTEGDGQGGHDEHFSILLNFIKDTMKILHTCCPKPTKFKSASTRLGKSLYLAGEFHNLKKRAKLDCEL